MIHTLRVDSPKVVHSSRPRGLFSAIVQEDQKKPKHFWLFFDSAFPENNSIQRERCRRLFSLLDESVLVILISLYRFYCEYHFPTFSFVHPLTRTSSTVLDHLSSKLS
jgi:hypothetical protein